MPPRQYQTVVPILLIALICSLITPFANGIKFSIPAYHYEPELALDNRRCVSAYVAKNMLVHGEFHSQREEHQTIEINVYDTSEHANKYYQHKDVDGVGKFLFTTLDHSEIFICFTNKLDQNITPSPTLQRTVSFSLNLGADAKEDSAFEEKNEHLKPVEIELLRLEGVLRDVVNEIEYLKHRSTRLRDTNESTNSRVLWFSILSIATLILLGSWQVMYLQQFFAAKKLI